MNLTARLRRAFDTQARFYDYAELTAPPSADGVQGDWAVCYGSGVPVLFGPKIDDTTWPPGVASTERLQTLGNVTGAISVDLSLGGAISMTLVGNTTITFINAVSGLVNFATLRVTQDATGNRTLEITGRQGSEGANALANLSQFGTDKVACESWDNGAHWDVSLVGQGIS